MARCLLFQSKLQSKFWAEAVNTSVYLLNKLPTRAVKDKTPFEAWYGFKPSVSHLKVFGCMCYALIPAERRTKLERRSALGIFVGYSSTKKGYRVYDPSTKKILVSRDIKFDEDKFWNWDDSETSQLDEDQLDISLELAENELESGDIDDPPVRGTEPLLTSIIDQKKVIGVKWVFTAKFNSDGSLNKHKARLVVKGYSQEYGTDFMETFAPIARLDTIKLLFALAVQKQWKIHQLNVKSAFLNGFLNEQIYIEQPEGFKVPGEEDKVYRLRKALYGLKQAPRAWYDRVDAYLCRLGFKKSQSEPTLYVKKTEDETLLIISVYVDDLLVTGSRTDLINDFKTQMKEVFDMTDLGAMTYFLSMEVNQSDRGIFISQQAFGLKILDKFCMTNCKSVSTPMAQGEKLTSFGNQERVDEKEYRSLVGCLLYLTATRPDLMHAVSLLSRFMHYCDTSHFKAAKRVLRYLKGTLKLGVMFKKENELRLVRYSDSDWAGSADDMRSTSGYFFTLGSGSFCWSSKKQQTVAQSTAEAEYIAVAAAVNQAIWLRKLLSDLNEEQSEATEIMVDNQSAVAIAKNPVFHGKTKHFKIKFHFVREAEQTGEISLVHCNLQDQLADILTKPLGTFRFEALREMIGDHGGLEFPLRTDNIKAIILDMLIAGTETSSTAVEWAMSELIKNPRILEKVKAKAIGRDSNYWNEAERFYPERFIDSSVDYKGTNFEFIPFGAGRRICPGMSYGMAVVELSLAQLLYHFDWKLPNGLKNEDLDMSETFGATSRRKRDLCLIPIPYHPTSSIQ
ncbi:hypothetical protein CXB51_000478 [Gossypium anomalum]|uniref:Cytochrome P450 n=1 Tax=Gossypium anomalum TaxID=47600 RepID=A0A8J5ZKS5_9ROSI|nr:hypothetical protein CXB51_000478 [Gossypium anomalum]